MVSRTANLAYQGESGALNESFADIFGASIEFYTNISPNWTIGEGIPNPALGFTFLRSMSNPNSGPAILGSQQPDTYPTNPTFSGSTQYWASTIPTYNANGQTTNDHGGVHTNSGVGNYWFYLLSAGGSGINDIGNNFNVTGITIQKAEKIAYRTLANYLTANSQFIDAYNASKQAVTDLYGATGNEQLQNVKAWYAVGIGNGLLSTSEIKNKIENQLAVYPNPVKNGIFTIENNSSEGIYEIYDASGKLIKNSDKLLKGNNKINVTGVEKGVYFVKINIEGSIVSKKIVIEK
ncbi:M4 family metallopeptidase [Chryseobacterium sp. RR2-3-20]|uniref:T9SS type A sorting domain-containing protein n=1 Tax=Chryseobacterium sp. RR2-3-20 TaxID=2787626 RepID=UPI00293D7C21|nr:M4 family metallopeptidase [Chryseobacterium sp. RR2-3-20]